MTGLCGGCNEESDSLELATDDDRETGYHDENWLCYDCRHAGARREAEDEARFQREVVGPLMGLEEENDNACGF